MPIVGCTKEVCGPVSSACPGMCLTEGFDWIQTQHGTKPPLPCKVLVSSLPNCLEHDFINKHQFCGVLDWGWGSGLWDRLSRSAREQLWLQLLHVACGEETGAEVGTPSIRSNYLYSKTSKLLESGGFGLNHIRKFASIQWLAVYRGTRALDHSPLFQLPFWPNRGEISVLPGLQS